ncbi:MAG: SCO family protein [Oligoflexia bacterium]|nr:SCO family protein [Oligoflexia bacterium]
MRTKLTGALAVLFALLGFPFLHFAQGAEVPPELKEVGISERLGSRVSLEKLEFRDESGRKVRLAEYFRAGRPVVLNLAYYGCPTLCGFIFQGMVKAFQELDWVPGQRFEVVTVSIDPREKPELAGSKKKSLVEAVARPGIERGWHFLTGSEDQIRALAGEVGFGYRYVAADQQYAHPAALILLTPEGKVSRYVYGIEYPPRDLKLSLIEASSGRLGTIIDRVLLFCYRYDPVTRRYSVIATRLVQAGSAVLIIALGLYLALFWRKQRREFTERESVPHV